MAENQQVASGGIGLGTILFVLFLTLKLTNHIDWSWFWVTSPLWIPFVLVLFFVIILRVVAGVAALTNR